MPLSSPNDTLVGHSLCFALLYIPGAHNIHLQCAGRVQGDFLFPNDKHLPQQQHGLDPSYSFQLNKIFVKSALKMRVCEGDFAIQVWAPHLTAADAFIKGGKTLVCCSQMWIWRKSICVYPNLWNSGGGCSNERISFTPRTLRIHLRAGEWVNAIAVSGNPACEVVYSSTLRLERTPEFLVEGEKSNHLSDDIFRVVFLVPSCDCESHLLNHCVSVR